MLKSICNCLKFPQFAKSEGGSVAILMGASMLFMVFLIAVVIDVSETNRARVNFQNALDAATLAAAKIIAADNDQAAALIAGRKVFAANLGNLDPEKGVFNIDADPSGCAGGDIVGQATLYHQVFFDTFLKVSEHSGREDHIKLSGGTSVACANDSIEIALVLDNSGSMGGTRLSTLKSAASDLVDEIHDSMESNPLPEPVKFALVPFSSSVNIGSHLSRRPIWQTGLDNNGISPIHFENIDVASWHEAEQNGDRWVLKRNGNSVSRFSFLTRMRQAWGGCVEARPYPLNTTDEEPLESNPSSLIVPMFAPDEPDNWSFQMSKVRVDSAAKEICVLWDTENNGNGQARGVRYCKGWTLGGANSSVIGHRGRMHPQDQFYVPQYDDNIEYVDGQHVGSATLGANGLWVNHATILEGGYANNYLDDDFNFPQFGDHPRATPNTGYWSGGQIKRQDWPWKYGTNGRIPTVSASKYGGLPKGPNFMCNSQAIQPLTSSRSKVLQALDNMQALGATTIPQGAVWGWRALSSGVPFTEGLPTGTPNNKKIMIIMSDGNNTYYPGNGQNQSLYGPYGYSKTKRIFDGLDDLDPNDNSATNLQAAMDIHLAKTCENAKEDEISIYTIAFEVPDGSVVKSMLNACASADANGRKQYYDATDKAALIKTFKDIAAKLSELTITE